MDDPSSLQLPVSPLEGAARSAVPAPVTHVPKAKGKPNATPMRVALGTGGLAVFSAIVSSIVSPPRPAVLPAGTYTGQATPATAQQPIRYVQLLPGQTAPPGATVIDQAAPTPLTIIATIPPVAQKPVVVRTTQSGKVIP